FRSERVAVFPNPENRLAFESALTSLPAKLGGEVPLVIGGERARTGKTFDSLNPSKPSQSIGKFQSATPREAESAIAAAERALGTWRKEPAERRADLL